MRTCTLLTGSFTKAAISGGDIGQRLPDGQVDLPRAREGGLKAMFFSLFVAESYYPARYETKQTLRLADLAFRQLEKNRDTIELALNASDIERITRRGKMAAVWIWRVGSISTAIQP
jgi:membrane dipeptidase